jgi:small conductance mechanosensitive channel
MTPAASIGGWNIPLPDPVVGAIVDVAILVVAGVGAWFVARLVAQQLRQRHVRGDMVVLGRRVATGVVVMVGIFAAVGYTAQNANVTLFGLLLATIVAALGLQQLLQDYVSGYYVLLERHLRVGDRISFDGHEGTIREVRLRVTLLESEGGDVVVVPNSELFTKPVIIRGRKAPEPKPEPPA